MMNKEVTTTFSSAVLPVLTSEFQGFPSCWIGDRCAGSFRINRQVSHKAILLYARETALYEAAAKLGELLVTWALIADDRQAHIYECNKPMKKLRLGENNRYDKKLECEWAPISDGIINAQSIDDYRGGYSWPGAALFGDELQRGLFGQLKAIKEELKRQFIRMIADKLEQAGKKNSFDHLMLIVPCAMIADLREQLDARTQNCIVGVLSKYPSGY